MFDLYSKLKENYRTGEPILAKDLKFKEARPDAVRQQLKKLTDQGMVKRFGEGVYYLEEKPSDNKVAEYKFVKRKNTIFGYYSGESLAMDLGIIEKKNEKKEIVTNDFKAIVRELKIGDETVTVRHSALKIDGDNCYTLRLLDMLKNVSFENYNTDETRRKLKGYIDKYFIRKSDVDKYIGAFPRKTYKNIYILNMNDIFYKEAA